MVQPTAKWSVHKTMKIDSAGRRNTTAIVLGMLYGVTKRPYRWRLIAGFATTKTAKSPDTSPAQNIPPSYMYGLELAGTELLRPAYSKASWMQSSNAAY